MKFSFRTWAKKHNIITSLSVAILIFAGFFWILPKTAVVYYSNIVEKAEFKVINDPRFVVGIVSDRDSKEERYGRVEFLCDEDNVMYLVEASNAPDSIEDITGADYIDTFDFTNGIATLSSYGDMSIFVESANSKSLSYCINMVTNERHPYFGKVNEIVLSEFGGDYEIYLASTAEIIMKDNFDPNVKMRKPQYRVYGCDSIKFYMKAFDDGNKNFAEFNKTISDFSLDNKGKHTLEFTMTANTQFKEIGNIDLSGKGVGASLSVDIKDLGSIPLRISVSGRVKEMEVSGMSCFIKVGQWLTENMTPILLSLITSLVLPILIKRSQKKEDAKTRKYRGRGRHRR